MPRPPFGNTGQRLRRFVPLATALSVSLSLGGCMSSPDPSEPLPVMARTEAQAWAQRMTEYMAQAAGVTLAPDSINPFFSNCVGKKDEVVNDGRYTLAYHAVSTLAVQQHPDAIRKIRTMLEKEGFTIKGYRETWQDQPNALLYAANDAGRYFIDVSTGGGTDRLLFTVSTRCLMPPITASPS